MVGGRVLCVADWADGGVRVGTHVTTMAEITTECTQLHSLSVRAAAYEVSVGADVKWHALSAEGDDGGCGSTEKSGVEYGCFVGGQYGR